MYAAGVVCHGIGSRKIRHVRLASPHILTPVIGHRSEERQGSELNRREPVAHTDRGTKAVAHPDSGGFLSRVAELRLSCSQTII